MPTPRLPPNRDAEGVDELAIAQPLAQPLMPSNPSAAASAYVSQHYAPRHPLLASASMIGGCFAWMAWIANSHPASDASDLWLAVKAVLGALAVLLAIPAVWVYLDGKLDPRTRISNCFAGVTMLKMDHRGVYVEGLGSVIWSDFVSYERFPNAHDYFQLHTADYSLAISGDRALFEPVIRHYFAPIPHPASAD